MWTEKTTKGYRFIERYQDPLTLKWHRVSVPAPSTSAQAAKIARRELDQKIAELTACGRTGKDMTLADLVEHYKVDQRITVKASTCRRNFFAANKLLGLLGSDVLVEKLTANYIREKLTESGLPPATLNECLTRLKAMLRWGYKNDYIESVEYLHKLERFKDVPKKVKIADKYLERDELQALLAALPSKQWRLLASFLALSGLRFGEAAALTRADVSGASITVSKGYCSNTKVTSAPKTASSIREVAIQPELRKIISEVLDYSRTRELALGYRSDLLFASDRGEHISIRAFNEYLKDHSGAVTHKKVTAHVFRHTHASLLMEAGIPIETISRRLGHESSQITREIYLHVTARLREKDADLIQSVSLL